MSGKHDKTSADQLRTVIEYSADGLLVIDEEGTILFANPAAAVMLRIPLKELLGFQLGLPSATDMPVEIHLPHKTGRFSTLELRARQITWNREDATLASLRDITQLKEAGEQIRKERNFAERVIETAQAIILVLDTAGRIVRFNPYMEEISAYRLEEVAGLDWIETFRLPEEHPEARERFRQSIMGRCRKGAQSTILTKDGRAVHIEWHEQVLQEEDGSVMGLLAVGQDVTEKRLIEEALRQSETRHKEAQKVGKIGHWTLVPGENVPHWSEEVFHILGLDPEQGEPSRDTLQENIHPDDRSLLNSSIKETAATGNPLDIKLRYHHPENRTCWLRILGHATMDRHGDVSDIFGTIQDITDIEQALAELCESQERYKIAVDGNNDGIWDWNLITDEVFFSPRWKYLLGYEDHELPNSFSEWERRLHPEDAERAWQSINDYLNGRSDVFRLEHRLRHKDGTYRWILARGVCQREENGKAVRMAGSHTDITSQKTAEEELRQNQKLLQNITENMFDMVTMTDLEGRRTYTSPSFPLITGYPPETLLGRDSTEFIHPEDMDRVLHKLAQIRQSSEPVREIFRYRHAEDRYIWLETIGKMLHDRSGSPSGMIFSSRDVTKRIQAEIELEKALSESRRQAAEMKHLLDGAKLILAGEEFEHISGSILKGMEEMIGARAGFVALRENEGSKHRVVFVESGPATCNIAPDQTMSLHSLNDKVVATSEPVYENHVMNSDMARQLPAGHMDLYNVMFVPLIIAGQTLGLIGLANKPTGFTESDRELAGSFAQLAAIALKNSLAMAEQKRLETQLHQSQKMESIGRLAGGIAHDFNNLLTVIQGFANLIHDDLHEQNPLREDAKEIQKAADSAAALTRQLLAFSRKQIISPRVLDLNEIVGKSEKMLRRLIGEDIELAFARHENLGLVKIDPNQVDQILVNLAVNARDAMPDGGKLTIETQNVRLESEKTFIEQKDLHGDFILLAVTDNGTGISREDLDRIFEPFFTTKSPGRGTGLGLSTIYGIIKQNHGYITVYSEPEQGTTFKIYLPRADETRDEPAEMPAVADIRGAETILLAEDQPNVRRMAQKTLAGNGYTVIAVGDGREALRLFEDQPRHIDLLLTDVVMPHMSGRELYSRLQARIPGLQVLYMSGYTENAIAHHGVLDVGTDFIQKPFRPADLAVMVRQVLDAAPSGTDRKNIPGSGRKRILLIEDEQPFHDLFERYAQSVGMSVLSALNGEEALEQLRAHGEEIAFIICDYNLPDCNGAELIDRLRKIQDDTPVVLVTGGNMPSQVRQQEFAGGKVVCRRKPTMDLKNWFLGLVENYGGRTAERNGS